MALNKSGTVSDIVAALAGLNNQTATPTQYWTAIIDKLYDRIVADLRVTSGIPVSTTGGPTAQTGTTTAPGMVT